MRSPCGELSLMLSVGRAINKLHGLRNIFHPSSISYSHSPIVYAAFFCAPGHIKFVKGDFVTQLLLIPFVRLEYRIMLLAYFLRDVVNAKHISARINTQMPCLWGGIVYSGNPHVYAIGV